jgi:hypothetical protein
MESESKLGKSRDTNQIMSIIYKTPKIRLLPEYEIYNSILGQPNLHLKESYDESIIIQIKELLLKKEISYKQIKNILTKNIK